MNRVRFSLRPLLGISAEGMKRRGRRPVTLRQSFRDAGRAVVGGEPDFSRFFSAFWYWIVGYPVAPESDAKEHRQR